MTTFSIRCSEEQKKKLNELLANHATGEEKVDFLLKSAVNSIDACISAENEERLHAVNNNLQQENERLQNELENLQNVNTDLQATNEQLTATNRNLSDECDTLRSVNDTVQKHIHESTTGERLSFLVPEPARSLLTEYSERMQVSREAILIDMFVRYVTEQYNRWFFDFYVRKNEFKDVCGYTHTEVLQWLNANK